MDHGVYPNYLANGLEGRERLLPVPVSPAPMRVKRSLRLPRVSLPTLPPLNVPVGAVLRHGVRAVVEFGVFVSDAVLGFARWLLLVGAVLGLGASAVMMLFYFGLNHLHECLVMAGYCFGFTFGCFIMAYTIEVARSMMHRAAGLSQL